MLIFQLTGGLNLMKIQLTINGVYLYDPTIFEGLQVPQGIDKHALIEWILNECGELSLVYNQPQFLKNKLKLWSAIRYRSWDKLLATTTVEYNPIHNYDRTETATHDNHKLFYEDVGVVEHLRENHSNTTTSRSDNGGMDVDQNDVTAFDGNDWTSKDRVSHIYGGNNEATGTISGNNQGDNDRKTSTNNDLKDSGVDTVRAYGNIGVTTTQQMLQAERELVLFDIYNHIVNEFKKEFCLLVY